VNVDGNPNNNRLPYDNRWVSTDKDTSYATGNSFSNMKVYGFTGVMDYDLSDTIALKSITGYRNIKWASGLDLDNSPMAILEPSFSLTQNQFSQEVQVIGSALDKKLNFVLGGYYFREEGKMRTPSRFRKACSRSSGRTISRRRTMRCSARSTGASAILSASPWAGATRTRTRTSSAASPTPTGSTTSCSIARSMAIPARARWASRAGRTAALLRGRNAKEEVQQLRAQGRHPVASHR
jgi:hypothetical protein